MREKLIDRIIEISKRNNGFDQGTVRWGSIKFKGILLSDLCTAVTVGNMKRLPCKTFQI